MLAGSLTAFPLHDVLSLLAFARRSGVVELSRGDGVRGRIWVLDGRIGWAVADLSRCPLADRLLHGEEVAPDDVVAIVHAQAAAHSLQVAPALVGIGVPADRVRELVRHHVLDAVEALSGWGDGSFGVDPELAATTGAPTLDVEEVLRVVRDRAEAWGRLLGPAADAVLTMTPRPPADEVTLDRDRWALLSLLDGTRNVGQVARRSGLGRWTTTTLLAELLDAGLVRPAPAAVVAPATPPAVDEVRLAQLVDAIEDGLGAGVQP